MPESFGKASLSISTSFGVRSPERFDTPVTLPPGRARLATRPLPTGSPAPGVTIGTLAVAFFAARAAGVPDARIASGLASSSSAARRGNVALPPFAKRAPRSRDCAPRHSRDRALRAGRCPSARCPARSTDSRGAIRARPAALGSRAKRERVRRLRGAPHAGPWRNYVPDRDFNQLAGTAVQSLAPRPAREARSNEDKAACVTGAS